MSVVVGCPDGTIKLLVKGADSTVLSLIGPGDDENTAERRESAEQLQWQAEVREQTLKHLDKYAREGLRTLVIASRVLTQKEVRSIRIKANIGFVKVQDSQGIKFEG
jgi:magnesium-transporting ATPase (P-type)